MAIAHKTMGVHVLFTKTFHFTVL